MSETGDKLHKAYGAMPRAEPSAAVDAAILAASRRALAKPSASRRWAAPVSIAAVLVLAFGVTLHMQQEKPGVESPEVYSSPPAGAKMAPPAEPEAARQEAVTPDMLKQEVAPAQSLRDARPRPEKKVIVPAAKPDFVPPPKAKLQEAPAQMQAAPAPIQAAPARPQAFEEDKARQRRDEGRAENEQKELLQKDTNANVRAMDAAAPKPAAPAPATTATAAGAIAFAPPPPAAAESASRAAAAPASPAAPAAAAPTPRGTAASEMRLKREAVTGVRGLSDAQLPADEPTRELEAIAKLRAEGRHEEADKSLAEFKRKRPDYRIPEAMWERVKPR